ncbi:MAG TPA: M48 family metalloprotease, partial [Planctomycetota bacterium]|nr:M48 family metalloprotease [Planctomycetota bacterium]
ISQDQAKSVGDASDAVRASWHEFTDSEEFYIGRSVAANVLVQYKALDDEALNDYVSRVGAVVAAASDRPQTYGGYHFQVLDTDEVNAFAAPGGFVFVTKGTLKLCENEDMLAAVLAHEVGHVVKKHGLQAISSSRVRQAFKALGKAGASFVMTPEQLREASEALSGSVADISDALLKSGYGKGAEKEADTCAAIYAARAGYDPYALVAFLDAMQRHEGVAKGGTFATHPKAADRIEVVKEVIADEKLAAATPATERQARFKEAVKL